MVFEAKVMLNIPWEPDFFPFSLHILYLAVNQWLLLICLKVMKE